MWKAIIYAIGAAMGVLASNTRMPERDIVPPNSLPIRITGKNTLPIPKTLYGYMYEDINHSGDGGLYAELIQNRAFQRTIPYSPAALTGWQSYSDADLVVTDEITGVSSALPNSLRVDIPEYASGIVGFENTGWWGFKVVDQWSYTGSFWAKSSSFTGAITVELVSTTDGEVFASATINGIGSDWKKFTYQFSPSHSAPNTNNVLRFTIDATSLQSTSLYFGLFSLFPPTFHGRQNGMRIDLATALADTNPGVWRFPGGNNLEGTSSNTRWKWNETIGPLEERPGRVGNWGYVNTDGLGLMEYLDFAEDLGAAPILGLWAGLSTGNYSDTERTFPQVPEAELQPYIDDVINELHFVTGDAASNQWAALRAKYGRKEPYNVTLLEIGNEDWFASGSYAAYRWRMFVHAIEAAFPGKFEYIATSTPNIALEPQYMKIDYHVYSTAEWFIANAHMLNDYPRNGTKWFVGEYAVTATNSGCLFGPLSCGRLAYPTVQGAIAEAAFMTQFERNADVVFASAYAPSLQNIDGTNWTPDLITFNAATLVKSSSYYVQQLFATNVGTVGVATVPPSSNSTAPLFWTASRDPERDTLYFKMVNAGSSDLVVNFSFDSPIGENIFATTLGGPAPGASNTLSSPNVVIPQVGSFAIQQLTGFNYTFPAQTLVVLTISTDGWV